MRKIGKYHIRGLLGRGGMSKVFKVEMPVIGKIVALKLLDPNPLLIDLIGREKIRELFTSEAIKLATLRHPNIVEIWDFGETDGKLFYVMDYYFNNIAIMIGETRRTERTSRIIKLDKAISYTRQTLSGLACLHNAGIVHRDIKPFNLLLTGQETVKICDFGLSKLRGETVAAPVNLKVGSPWYASPEQERNPEDVDFRSDLYATGVTLYRMLTGKLPGQHPERPSRLNPDLDDTWDTFIARSIALKPRERFSSTAEMLAELEKLNNAWQEKKENICRIAGPRLKQASKLPTTKFNLRSRAVKVDPRHARKVFSTDNLWRPQTYIQNAFETHPAGIITDRATGVSWQQAGSDYPMNWHQAHKYIEQLNRNQFADRTTWRLPTINELMSLLTETPHGEGFCIERIFDQRQMSLWSSDRRSYTAAWYVMVDMGFVSWQDFSAYYFVRGVCGN
jgi:serine/threonine-protein kinase